MKPRIIPKRNTGDHNVFIVVIDQSRWHVSFNPAHGAVWPRLAAEIRRFSVSIMEH